MIKVLFDMTHQELQRLHDESKEGLSEFNGTIDRYGYAVELIRNSFLAAIRDSDAKVLWISVPTINFTSSEIAGIHEFVSQRGGGLLLTAEWGNLQGNATVLNNISTSLGVKFNSDRVTDLAHAFTEEVKFMGEVMDRRKVPQFVEITKFAKHHPIVSGINSIVYFAGCSLEVTPPERALAWSAPTSFSDLDADKKYDVGEETKGSFCVASSSQYGKGRVVCVGDASIMANNYIHHADNRKFCVNLIRWLAGELPIGVRKKLRKKKKIVK